MNAQVWVQALTLGSSLAALGWALTGGPLRISNRASRHFLAFNALVALGSLAWWPGPQQSFLSPAYCLTLGLVGVLSGMQGLCLGLHKLHDIKPSYVVSPFMLPFLAALMVVIAWLDSSGRGALLACFSASLWMMGVTVQQGFAAMSAQAGTQVARWALLPFSGAALLWLVGMGHAAWAIMVSGGAAEANGPYANLLGVPDALTWLVTWALVNGGLVCLVMLKLVDKIRDLSTEDDLTGAMNMRTFMALLRDERERIRRVPLAQTLLVCEVDQHHELNKQLGFSAGDAALRHVTGIIGRGLRKTDRLASSMQGELLLFLTGTPAVGATLVAERTQASVKANPFLWKGQAINLSLSIGLSSREDGSMPDETLIELANQAVQRARREGGSRIRMTTFDPATLEVGVTSTTEQVPPKRDTGAA
ncbi:MAG: GGDEF domain-containing protein [Burkholderiales bacterium]|nr:GGDEF domain-containing protein [Burkholderiales bacterium]